VAKVYVNLARMTTATTGAGVITLGSAVAGCLSFAAAGVANGDTLSYGITDGVNSEVGLGTYASSGTTLTRTTVLASTNGGAAISLSGSAEVFCCPLAADFRPKEVVVALTDGGTGQTTAATAFAALKQDATDAATGVVELATAAETIAGTDTTRALTAADLAAWAPARVYAETATRTAISATIPVDNTIPQISEGTEVLSLSITPKRTTNKIKLRFTCQVSSSVNAHVIAVAALFVAGTNDALAATLTYATDANQTAYLIGLGNLILEYEHTPGVTTSTTYSVRLGNSAGTFYINGTSVDGVLGGVIRATLSAEELYA
jgi:hypothetical protein